MPPYETTPHPVQVIVCSLCGISWKEHLKITSDLTDGEIENVSPAVCVQLLRMGTPAWDM